MIVAAPTGKLEIKVWRAGVLVEHTCHDNLVVASSKPILAQLLGGNVTGNPITQIGFGSNTASVATGNTSLSVDAYLKAVDSVSYPAPGRVAFAFSLGIFEDNGATIAEYGLLNSNGTLFARLVRTAPLIKDLSVNIASTWSIAF